ncbi:hypothetical protein M2408_003669 [Sphingobacterium sp. BIGb0165]|nr:hypothetical protein [Sphingobacterium sp. BIGb0165]
MEALFSLKRSHFPTWVDKFALLLLYIVLGLDDLVGWIFRLLTCRDHFDTRPRHFPQQLAVFVGCRNGLVSSLFRFVHGLDDLVGWNYYLLTCRKHFATRPSLLDSWEKRYFTRVNDTDRTHNCVVKPGNMPVDFPLRLSYRPADLSIGGFVAIPYGD